jgi:uroporphyrinogen-III synthase
MRLLVTRPDPEGERTARALEKLGHHVTISAALDIRYLIDAPFVAGKPQAILVTSVNAVRALERHAKKRDLLACPVLAVGDRTAVEAKRAGFASAVSAQGALDDLCALVKESCTPAGGTLLYAAGADQAGDLAGQLGRDGFAVETMTVYRAEKVRDLTDAARRALHENEIDGVLFYSARSAAAFGEQLKQAGLAPLGSHVTCYCLSQAVAEAAGGLTSGPLKIAETPDQLALFALIEA